MGEPIYDFISLVVPDALDPADPDAWDTLDAIAQQVTMRQYKRPPKALVMDKVRWLITSDWQDVEAFQPAHDCAACRAGNDQAVAFLKEFPDKRLALGNMKYWEIW